MQEAATGSAVEWEKCASHEQDELLKTLFATLTQSVFRGDVVWLEERRALVFNEVLRMPVALETVQIAGHASIHRKALYECLLRKLSKMVSNIRAEVKFTVQEGDALPHVSLVLLRKSPESVAKLHWRRAMMGMLCGVVQKIGEARGIAARISRSSISKSSTSLSVAKKSLRTPRFQTPLLTFQDALRSEEIELARLVSNLPTIFILWASWDDVSMQFVEQNIFSNTESSAASPPRRSPRKGRATRADPWLEFCVEYFTPRQPRQPPEEGPLNGSPRQHGFHRSPKPERLCNIVLVNVDAKREDAEAIVSRWCAASQFVSARVGLHCMWAENGLQSPLASFFDVPALPFLFVADPLSAEPVISGGGAASELVPPQLSRVVTSECRSPSPRNRRDKELRMEWHEIPSKKRSEVEKAICTALRDSSIALLSFKTSVRREFHADDDRQYLIREASHVSLRGTAGTQLLEGALSEPLSFLQRNVRNFVLSVAGVAPSAPIRIPFNQRTPEHIVKGWTSDVTCAVCRRRVHVNAEPISLCLQCGDADRCLCSACGLSAHPPHHTLAKLHLHTDPHIPVLWGPSNVHPMPTLDGKLIRSVSNTHVGVYCNICCRPIHGVRWKCLMCLDADMCDCCEAAWFANVLKGIHDRRHPTDHIFVRIACAVPGDSSSFLVPAVVTFTG